MTPPVFLGLTHLSGTPSGALDALTLIYGRHGYITSLAYDDVGKPRVVVLEVRQLDFGSESFGLLSPSAIPADQREAYRRAVYEAPYALVALRYRARYNVAVDAEHGWVDMVSPDGGRITELTRLGHA